MNRIMISSTIAAACFITGSAMAQPMSLAQGSAPSGSSSLFNAVGTFNFGNQKARLEAAGQTTLQGGNPGNGWWGPNTGTGGLERSWEVIWNNTLGTVTFNLYASNDFSGLPAMTMTQTPVFTAGYTLVGLDIGARLTNASMGVTISGVEFNDGSGFVSVGTANASYSGNAFFNNYHAINGTLGSFTLRGITQFTSGTTTGDSMRFFVNGIQAVPTPGAAALIGLGGLAATRRRRR
ncbi:MAG: hypothetical protein KIT68_10390 [Phycisphaeraceae bacterium]|nr:hypothetical protein [Phycisphaeraceae bacterium]